MTDSNRSLDELTPLQRAAYSLREMRARYDALRAVHEEPIAIVGMSCRYPGGANTPERFWQLLRDRACATAKVPRERWDADAYYDQDPDKYWKMYTREGCFVDQRIDLFDAPFFGMSPREAAMLDPQQRLLLEITWEALENAGVAPDRLDGSATGVYIGVITGDYGRVSFQRIDPPDLPYVGLGNDMSFAAGRLSYVLGLQGPSMVIATACSSTLATTHVACQALRARECDLALSGGVSLMVYPDTSIVLSKMRATAPDGRSKTFDASADGFGRGEGCGMLVLKRLSDAQRDGDRVLALVRGSAVNHDGQSGGITVPNGPSQEKLLRKALESARLTPRDIDYIETHGTGTPLGDPIEAQALDAVFGPAREADRPLLIGSVKTNIGHLEAAAGVAGIMKVALAMQNEQIPAHLHFRTPNPRIPWDEMHLEVTAEPRPWPRGERLRLAGVSSFGLSGVNGHVILEEAPLPAPAEAGETDADAVPGLLVLSAKTENALRELAGRYAAWLSADGRDVRLADLCFSASTGRAQLSHRAALVADDREVLGQRLAALAAGQQPPALAGVSRGQASAGKRPRVAFLFTGQGAQRVGMARELYEREPRFRELLDRCDAILRPHLDRSLLSVMYPDASAGPASDADSPIHDTAYTQPALVAVEIALAALWRSWGVEPAVVMGHSVGEIAAACVAGVMSMEDALTLAAIRGRLMQALPRDGEMVAVRASEAQVADAIRPHARDLSIAAVNGPADVVISGRREPLRQVVAALAAQGFDTKPLQVSHAFHSPLMEPMLAGFREVVQRMQFHAPEIPLISNLSGGIMRGEAASREGGSGQAFGPDYWSDYWVKHVRAPVRFAAGMQSLAAQGASAFVEIGPAPVLLGLGRSCVPDDGMVWLPSLRRNRPDCEQMRSSLAELWVRGAEVDLAGLYRGGAHRKLVLPNYPFQRKRYWMQLKPMRGEGEDTASQHPMLGSRIRSAARAVQFEGAIGASAPGFLSGHRVYDEVIVPGAAYIEMAAAAGTELYGAGGLRLDEIRFHTAMRLDEDELRTVQVILTPLASGASPGAGASGAESGQAGGDAGMSFELHSFADGAFVLHASGRIAPLAGALVETAPARQDCAALARRCDQAVSVAEFYQRIGQRGIEYGPSFRPVTRFGRGDSEAFGALALPETLVADADAYRLHPVLLDGCFQVLGAVFPEGPAEFIYLPVGIGRLVVHGRLEREVRVHARMRDGAEMGQRVLAADFTVLSPDGRVLAELEQLEFQQAPREALLGGSDRVPRSWFYEESWRPAPAVIPAAAAPAAANGAAHGSANGAAQATGAGIDTGDRWLILADTGEIGRALAARLTARGATCVLAFAGSSYDRVEPGVFRMEPDSLADARRILTDAGAITGIAHLWSLDLPAPEAQASPEAQAPAEAPAAWRRALGSALYMARAAVETGTSPRLVLVTRGAVAAGTGPLPGLAQVPVHGFGKAVAQEHPELRCLRVDLDPEAGPDAAIGAVDSLVGEILQPAVDQMTGPMTEDDVCFRGGQRLVPRLVRCGAARAPVARVALPAEGSYLITGGLGGLGLQIARRLVERGARHLMLMGRSAPRPEAEAAIRALEEMGATVVTLRVDVSDEPALVAALAEAERTLAPLRGVVHLAAVIDDGMLLQQDTDRFDRVLAAKAVGAWNLHRFLASRDLDFFVLFSSAASLMGQAGQAGYVAANAFLDALAHHRRGLGLPALSINWGAWGEVGAAATDRVMERVRRMGVTPISPAQGLAAFEQLLAQDRPQVGVVAVDWQAMQRLAGAPFFSELVGNAGNDGGADFLQRYQATPASERPQLLVAHVRELVMRVLGLDPGQGMDPDQGFFEAGMDSLMAAELRNAIQGSLGRTLPVSTIFDHPSIHALAAHLGEALASDLPDTSDAPATPDAVAAAGAPPGQPSGPDDDLASFLEEVSQMSDADLTQALGRGRSGGGAR